MAREAKQLFRIHRIEELDEAIDISQIKNRNDLVNLLVSIYLDTCHNEVIKKAFKDEFATYEYIRSKMSQPLDQ